MEKLYDSGLVNDFFLDLNPTSQAIKAKIDKYDCNQLKSFCKAKEITQRKATY